MVLVKYNTSGPTRVSAIGYSRNDGNEKVKNAIGLDYVGAIPVSSCAGAKTTLDRASFHT